MKLGLHPLLTRAVRGSALVPLACLLFVVCTGFVGNATEANVAVTETAVQTAATAISISGTISNAAGQALSGVAVELNGSKQAHVTTGASGSFAFTGLNPGSYSVQPSLTGCSFAPSVVNLNNLSASATVDFAGSGSTCGGAAAPIAPSGSLTLSGEVTDAAGNAIAGVHVALNGSSQAVTVTSATGAYSFSVNPGSYSLTLSGVCASFAPSVVNLNDLTKSQTQSFTASGCPTPTPPA